MQHQTVSKATFSEVIELVNSGQLARAEEICIDALNRSPKNVNMTGLYGALLFKLNRLDEAVDYLQKTTELAPTFAKPYEDLGLVYLAMKKPDEAIDVLKKATRLDPGLEIAYLNLGKALAMTGRGKEADEAIEKAFELSPERKALALAAESIKNKRFDEAEKHCRGVLQKNPINTDAMRLLSKLAIRINRVGEAEKLLRRAIEITPDFTGATVDLARLMQNEDRLDEAIHYYKKAVELEPENPNYHDELGYALAPAARTYEAIEAHQKAIDLKPDFAPAWLGLGHMLKTVGRQEEAIHAYRQCTKLKPDHGMIHWSLANLKTYRFTDEEIEDMKTRASKEDVTGEPEINFLFALAKACEDRQDYDQAWHYYSDGNAKRRMQESYDPIETEITMNQIMEVFNKDLLEQNTGIGNPDESPIFIMGLPRSGSTLLEQILASHSLVEGTSELAYISRVCKSLDRNRADGINYPEAVVELKAQHLQNLGQDFLDHCQIHRVEGTRYFIDKNPNNFPQIGFVHMILPNAKIIDARRHPVDACFSCYRQLFAKGQPFTYDLTDIGEYFLQYQRIMDHWHEVLPGRVLTVQYEEVVSDLENQVRHILDFCGLPWEDACLNFYDTDRPVRTASSEQVRQPIYTQSMDRWRHYEQYLDELRITLEPVMERYKKFEAISSD